MKYYRKGTKARKASMRRRAIARSVVSSVRTAERARLDAPSMSSGFAKAVLSVVNRKEETKYRADDIQKTVPVDVNINIPGDLVSPLPNLVEGTGSWQRVGQHITNVRGKTHFNFSIDYNYSASVNWVVRLYMLTSKQVKAYSQISSLSANTLLDNGDGTTIDWIPGSTQVITLSQRPLARENFTGSFRDFKLSKNSGALNGDSSTPPPSPNGGHFASNHQFTWHWKHKGKVMYDENSYLPTNYNPMFILVAFPYDNTPVPVDPATAPVKATIRTEMFYKDS